MRYLLLLSIVLIGYSSCKKNDDECPACPSVTSIFPTSGKGGDILTIKGINFSAVPAENIVKINKRVIGVDSIISCSETEVKVIVPANCGTGPVTIDFDQELVNQGTPPIFQYVTSFLVNQSISINQPWGITYNTTNNKMYVVQQDQASNLFNVVEISSDGISSNIIYTSAVNQVLKDITMFGSDIYLRLTTNSTPSQPDKILKISGSSSSTLSPTFNNYSVNGVAIDPSGNIYVACYDEKIYRIASNGSIITYAGTGVSGSNDGPASSATFSSPYGLTIDNQGNLYVTQIGTNQHKIRKITPAGNVTTVAGSGAAGSVNGASTIAQFNSPKGIISDNSGNLYVADYNGLRIRKIDASGNVSTLAGTGFPGNLNGPATSASFQSPYDLAIDGSGKIWVTDVTNNLIRIINQE